MSKRRIKPNMELVTPEGIVEFIKRGIGFSLVRPDLAPFVSLTRNDKLEKFFITVYGKPPVVKDADGNIPDKKDQVYRPITNQYVPLKMVPPVARILLTAMDETGIQVRGLPESLNFVETLLGAEGVEALGNIPEDDLETIKMMFKAFKEEADNRLAASVEALKKEQADEEAVSTPAEPVKTPRSKSSNKTGSKSQKEE